MTAIAMPADRLDVAGVLTAIIDTGTPAAASAPPVLL
jgi:hypothetical protein